MYSCLDLTPKTVTELQDETGIACGTPADIADASENCPAGRRTMEKLLYSDTVRGKWKKYK